MAYTVTVEPTDLQIFLRGCYETINYLLNSKGD